MKPNAMAVVAALSTLLPLCAAAQTESSANQAQFFISQRVWFADWNMGAVESRIEAPSASQPVPVLRSSTGHVRDRRAVPLTSLGVSLDRWTLSTTIGWSTEFSDARLDSKPSRSEYDVNLGYAVTPNISAVVLYKAGKSDIPTVAGSAAPQVFRSSQKLRGGGLGLSGRYRMGENWNAYGSAAYGAGHSSFSSGERYFVRYTVAEAGVGYRIPGAPANLSLTAGYRYQNLNFPATRDTLVTLTTPPSTTLGPAHRLQSSTQGWTLGLAGSF